MRRHGRWLLATLGVAVLVAAGALAWHLRRQQQTYFTDAASIHQSAEAGLPRDILWAPPSRLSEIVNTTADEHGAALSLDGNELYFVRGRAGGGADIHVMRRGPEGWTAPDPVAALNTHADELRPALSPDGRSLYFASNRPGGTGGYDIWVARRGPRGWRTPENLGAEVNSRYDDYAPATDGRVLYFASNRPKAGDETAPPDDAWAAQIADDAQGRDYDLYVAADGAVIALDDVNSASNE
ncbi:MAG: TolB family protein, partial [Planctomycetota bacterium]